MDTVEKEVKYTKSWFDFNEISLNLSKTKFTFTGNQAINTLSKPMINGTEIERVSEITLNVGDNR